MAELTITTDQLRELSYRLRQLYLDQLARLYLKITPVDTSNACGPQITLTTYVKKGFELWIARKTNKRRSTVGELREMLKYVLKQYILINFHFFARSFAFSFMKN